MQLAPPVALAVALTLLQVLLVVQPLQAQLAQGQLTQTQAQLTRILATLEEVSRLAGRVECLDT